MQFSYAGRHACPPLAAKLADCRDGNSCAWQSFSDVQQQIGLIDPTIFPVVLITLKNIPCAEGCCLINLFVRSGTTDSAVVRMVMVDEEYDFLLDMSDFEPSYILDAGGNIGITSVLYAMRYPNATIITVEPSIRNFEVLELNTRRFGKIRLENKGLWNRNAHLKVSKTQESTRKGHWGFEVQEVDASEGSDVLGASIDYFMIKHNIEKFDMIKMDIEGSEKVVFDDYRHPKTGDLRKWLCTTDLFIAEAHDDIQPGALAAIETAIQSRSTRMTKSTSGELHVWKSEEFKTSKKSLAE